MIIAIDGPSGAGKSTLGKMLAKKLNLLYLDTGAMYRAVALAVREAEVPYRDVDRIADLAEDSRIELVGEPDAMKVLLDGRDVSVDIRTLEAAQAASVVSTISEVRRIMVEHQRIIGEAAPIGCVLEGRQNRHRWRRCQPGRQVALLCEPFRQAALHPRYLGR